MGVEITHTKSGRLPRLPESPLVGGETEMTRTLLSLKLGISGGFIWGLLFAAYYSMLPYITISQEKRFAFAWQSATLCFVIMVIVILALPYLRDALKKESDE
jgi:hypothetical protein